MCLQAYLADPPCRQHHHVSLNLKLPLCGKRRKALLRPMSENLSLSRVVGKYITTDRNTKNKNKKEEKQKQKQKKEKKKKKKIGEKKFLFRL